MESRLPVELVCVDLEINKVVKKIFFPQDVALPSTYLNDVRFDLRYGKGGQREIAFITDSSQQGPNGIIVVDLESGKKAGAGSTTIHQPRLKIFKTLFR